MRLLVRVAIATAAIAAAFVAGLFTGGLADLLWYQED